MKNIFKITLALTLVVVLASGCQQKTSSTKKKSSSSSSDGLTGGDDDNTTTTPGLPTGCVGIYRDGATKCYYKNIPQITLNGAGNPNQTGASAEIIGPVLWSSVNNLPSSYDRNSFVTDATFHLRIKAIAPAASEKTVKNRLCSNAKFTRVKVYFMLRNSITSATTTFSTTAKVGLFSEKVIVEDVAGIPGGAQDKILEVVGIMSDHRCHIYNPPAGCSDGTYWGDIPLNTTNAANPTSCAAFTIQYATDTTHDLP